MHLMDVRLNFRERATEFLLIYQLGRNSCYWLSNRNIHFREHKTFENFQLAAGRQTSLERRELGTEHLFHQNVRQLDKKQDEKILCTLAQHWDVNWQ